MPKPVDHQRVSVREPLETADETQRILGNLLRSEFPNHTALAVELKQRFALPACHQNITAGQLAHLVGIARRLNLAHEFSLGTKLEHSSLAFCANQIPAILRASASPHLVMGIFGFHRNRYLTGNAAVAPDFDQSPAPALHHHHQSIGQGLAAMHLAPLRT